MTQHFKAVFEMLEGHVTAAFSIVCCPTCLNDISFLINVVFQLEN